MKKLLSLFLIILILTALTACSGGNSSTETADNPSTETSENQENSTTSNASEKSQTQAKVEVPELYQNLLQRYKNGITQLNEGSSSSDAENLPDVVKTNASSGDYTTENIGYEVTDIDGDGFSDLIIGIIPDNSIIEINAESPDNPHSMSTLAVKFDNTDIFLCEGAILEYVTYLNNTQATGGVEIVNSFEQYNTSTAMNGGTEIEAVSEAFGTYYLGSDDDPNNEISESEYNSILESYPVVQLNLTPLADY